MFHSRAQGNALLLRELVTAALQAGRLVEHNLVWRLAGDPPVSGGVRGLVTERLAGLDGSTRVAIETVAATEPLALDVARELVGEGPPEGEETWENRQTPHRWEGGEMPRLRLHRLRLGAARATEQTGAGRPTDRVRAPWATEAGQTDDPDRLLAAARGATSRDGRGATGGAVRPGEPQLARPKSGATGGGSLRRAPARLAQRRRPEAPSTHRAGGGCWEDPTRRGGRFAGLAPAAVGSHASAASPPVPSPDRGAPDDEDAEPRQRLCGDAPGALTGGPGREVRRGALRPGALATGPLLHRATP